MNLVDQIKQRLDILDVAGRLGIDLRRVGGEAVGECPSGHGSSSHTPFHVYSDRFICFHEGCGAHGDLIDLIALKEHCDLDRAMARAADMAGIAWTPKESRQWTPEAKAAHQSATAIERRCGELRRDAAGWFAELLAKQPVILAGIERKWGFGAEVVQRWGLGYAPADSRDLVQWLRGRGYSTEEMLASGLVVRVKKDPSRLRCIWSNRITIPYWGGAVGSEQEGQPCAYMTGRLIDASVTGPGHEELRTPAWNGGWSPEEPDRQPTKYFGIPHQSDKYPEISPQLKRPIFNSSPVGPKDLLALVEGPMDVIAVSEAGLACVGLSSSAASGARLPRLRAWSRWYERICCLADNDAVEGGGKDAGLGGARKTLAALETVGVLGHLAITPLEEGERKADPASWLMGIEAGERGAALRELVESAPTGLEWEIQRLARAELGDGAARSTALEGLAGRISWLGEFDKESYVRMARGLLGLSKREESALLRVAKQAAKERKKAERGGGRGKIKEAKQEESQQGGGGGERVGALPMICISDKQLSELIEDTWDALLPANVDGAGQPVFYVRDGCIVHIIVKRGIPSIAESLEQDIYSFMTRIANWVIKRAKDGETYDVPVMPPREVAKDIIAKPHADLPVLEDIVTSPVFDCSGRFISRPGYDGASQIFYYDSGLGKIDVPADPSDEDIDQSRRMLFEDLYCDFPFVAPSDYAHLMAVMLAAIGRRLIHGCIMLNMIEAPTAGSGKGLLADVISIIICGQRLRPNTFPDSKRNDDEIRKKITAILKRGESIVLIDNVEGLDSPHVASLATTPIWEDRELGVSKNIALPNNAVWIITANNPTLSNELFRRFLRIRIDRKTEKPWIESDFRHEQLRSYAMQNRARFFRALAILAQAWVARGRPAGNGRRGSFEEWAPIMSGMLDVIGIPGFLEDQEEAYEKADESSLQWRAFIVAWWERFHDQHLSIDMLRELADGLEEDSNYAGYQSAKRPERYLQSVISGDKPRSRNLSLSKHLQKIDGRVYSDYVVYRGNDTHANCSYYYLTPLSRLSTEKVFSFKPILSQSEVHASRRSCLPPPTSAGNSARVLCGNHSGNDALAEVRRCSADPTHTRDPFLIAPMDPEEEKMPSRMELNQTNTSAPPPPSDKPPEIESISLRGSGRRSAEVNATSANYTPDQSNVIPIISRSPNAKGRKISKKKSPTGEENKK